MRLNKVSSLVLVMVCLSLVGCANKWPYKGKNKHRNQANQESAMTQGVGQSTEFINKDQDMNDTKSNLDGDDRYDSAQNTKDKNTYLFAFDRFDVADHDIASVHAHADYLKKHPGTKIYINGHTDQRGSREYNIALGERRAKSVTQILISRGVSPNQIKVVSYGAEKPAAQGSDEGAYSKNRRAQTVYE